MFFLNKSLKKSRDGHWIETNRKKKQRKKKKAEIASFVIIPPYKATTITEDLKY